jgi:hypothetical protein
MCVLIFSTTFVWNISHSKQTSARYYFKCTQARSSCKVPVIVVSFNETLNFLDRFSKINTRYQISLKSVQWGTGVSCGQTDMTKLIVAFRNFANAPKKKVSASQPRLSIILIMRYHTLVLFMYIFLLSLRRFACVSAQFCQLHTEIIRARQKL